MVCVISSEESYLHCSQEEWKKRDLRTHDTGVAWTLYDTVIKLSFIFTLVPPSPSNSSEVNRYNYFSVLLQYYGRYEALAFGAELFLLVPILPLLESPPPRLGYPLPPLFSFRILLHI